MYCVPVKREVDATAFERNSNEIQSGHIKDAVNSGTADDQSGSLQPGWRWRQRYRAGRNGHVRWHKFFFGRGQTADAGYRDCAGGRNVHAGRNKRRSNRWNKRRNVWHAAGRCTGLGHLGRCVRQRHIQ